MIDYGVFCSQWRLLNLYINWQQAMGAIYSLGREKTLQAGGFGKKKILANSYFGLVMRNKLIP